MNLNYEKVKSKIEHGGNPWTSYSDLFLVLSVIFLLLYVVTNLRSGATSYLTVKAYKAAMQENETLKKQIETYEVLKDDYLHKGASETEVAAYQQLVRRLDLLGEETKEERTRMEQQAHELNEKEKALNQYQQLMKGIINANMVAQARLKFRDVKIEERDVTIKEKEKNISELNRTVAQKAEEVAAREQEIAKNNQRISDVQSKLEKSIQEVRYAYRAKKKSQDALQTEISRLKQVSEEQVSALQKENAHFTKQLRSAQENIADKNRELERTLSKLQETEQERQATVAKAKEEHTRRLEKMAKERAAFEQQLAATKLGAEEKLKKQQAYLAQVEGEKAKYNTQLQQVQGDLESTRKNIQAMTSQYQGSYKALAHANDTLKKNLQESIAKRNERKVLAQRIAANLKRAGVGAQVDAETGEVTLQFSDTYFDYGKAELKQKMRESIARIFPTYAAAIFEDPLVAKKIATVEIVGFASPTFRGKFVDPESLRPEDRAAVNFNMDLSYQRAKSIFEHAFDTTKLQFKHQKDLLPIVHVTGRSYLTERKSSGRNLASAPEFCQAFDCQKSQKVIIKFNLTGE